jgi:hypothetical protein
MIWLIKSIAKNDSRFIQPNAPVPSLANLREGIAKYVRSTNTEVGYLHNESPNYSKYIDELLATDFLNDAGTPKEIAHELKLLFGLEILHQGFGYSQQGPEKPCSRYHQAGKRPG